MKIRTAEQEEQIVVLDQQLALGAYLQALLKPPQEQVRTETVPESKTQTPVEAPVETKPVEAKPVEAKPVEAKPVEAKPVEAKPVEVKPVEVKPVEVKPVEVKPVEVKPVEAEPPEVRADVEVTAATESAQTNTAPAHPAWAVGEFQCLLFRAGGIRLAVPLSELNGVLRWAEQTVTPMPGHAHWFLGVMNWQGENTRIVDTADFIVPAGRRAGEESGEPPDRIILINEAKWGLTATEVEEVITLSADHVKWRTQAGSRPWLAGTVIDKMCALLEVDQFARMLLDGDRS